MAHAGKELGLDDATALGLAKAMVEGSALLAADSDEKPDELARRVTSPGGTTAAGLAVLDDRDQLKNLVLATLTAARDRGAELADLPLWMIHIAWPVAAVTWIVFLGEQFYDEVRILLGWSTP